MSLRNMVGRGLQVVAHSDTLDHLAQQSMTEGKKGGKFDRNPLRRISLCSYLSERYLRCGSPHIPIQQ
jgi:hypothetical protein